MWKKRLQSWMDRIPPRGTKERRRFMLVTSLAACALYILLPMVVANTYVLHIVIVVGIYCILALSLNLVVGFAGQLSFGHIAFYGVGAYTGALLMLRLGVSFWLALPISALFSALAGFLLGLPTLRLRGDYLAIVTLGFGEIVRLVLINTTDLTRGPLGLPGIPAPKIFGYSFSGPVPYYYIIALLVAFTVFFLRRLTTSGIGLSMLTVKGDEIAASSIGILPVKYKLMAFVLSSAFAGAAGTFYASYISFISPDTFIYNGSVTILAMVVLGGLGSIPGSMIGAALLLVVPELLRAANEYRMILYGLLMVVMMIYRPQGFWGMDKRVLNAYKLSAGGERRGK
ncbi:MAG: branched-chain amino acid ABC transporter permease [Christensenellales bacterium]